MLSAAAFSLLVPAIQLMGQTVEASWWVRGMEIAIAATAGGALFYGLEKILPEPFPEQQTRSIWLFVLAIALHHFPEGLAVGLGTATTHNATIAIGVALQNLPEGLMVAIALRQLGYGVPIALALAAVSGWLEPLGGLVGVTLADVGTAIAPIGMALAAGAMLFVVLHGLLPQVNLKQLNSQGPVGVITGVVMMSMVQQFLG